MNRSNPPEAFFLPIQEGRRGQRFCLLHQPGGGVARGAIVYVHPFAEELNKSRRMAARQARAFCDAGYAVLQIDLSGCGDSSGDFGDATWPDWVADVTEAGRWLLSRVDAPLWLWGLRAGCLLASEAAHQFEPGANLLLWQPPSAGKLLLTQFLRLRLAGDMLDGKSKGLMESMRQQLAAGRVVEIAGYALGPGLAAGLETATLKLPASCGRIEWVEITSRIDAGLSAASERQLAAWRDAGIDVRTRVVGGPAFWQTTEIEEVDGLIGASLAALDAPVQAMAA